MGWGWWHLQGVSHLLLEQASFDAPPCSDSASCLQRLQAHEAPYDDDALSGHLVEGAAFQRHQRRSGLDVRKATLPAVR
eukprot:8693910-Alexandrium_andersonii.AAC.1